ncbi:hypothetical protein [Sediminispirochaeta smaragdinae]|uniref:Uncharacterized protein n=1 Tax=Sediminispirochaeta smaragdinae (strain DSM 11293 / JCM 15392 / SEBR 4228) TaxID=573413 RepID=E1R6Q1_SEDSS|nr:hypothetical protein [Sediminispirochaeta smaragdinae]ADK79183.1 hypothetical protein Spirs_0023 [Sediminispirochaeta smaragdinae DSM 11293]
MKKYTIMFIIAAGMVFSSGSTLFAEGAQEDEDFRDNPYQTVTVSGKIYASFSGFPELKGDDGKTYRLMFPMFLADSLELSNGESVSVEGFSAPANWRPTRNPSDAVYLRLVKATIDGQTYDLSRFYGHMGPGGPGRFHEGWGCFESGYDDSNHMVPAPGMGGYRRR